ncbi:MAG: RNA 3'-phosphate cyclase [Thermoprotei archaeon]|nr:MAG: RNA 3'-phosphate cyclase [Thermoprotei archaeon]
MIEIDGSMLEGGGQILRLSVAISAVSGIPVKVFNIRAKRSNPGLRPQHLTAIKAVAELVNAEVEGLKVGSRELTFMPKNIKGGRFSFDIGTAGATTLVLQSLMPAAAYAPTHVDVEIRGGTNNPMAPPIDYVERVLVPILAKMGYRCKVVLLRRGFYPRGGGIIRLHVEPADVLKSLTLYERGEVVKVSGIAYSCRLPSHIVDRMTKSAESVMKQAGYEVDIEKEVLQQGHPKCSLDPGCGILLVAETSTGALIGSDALGEKGKPAEKVGEEAARNLVKQLATGASVDRHMGDQVLIYMALAEGLSKIKVGELTLHALTCIELLKRLLKVDIEVEGKLGEPATITCRGIGMRRRSG